MRISIILLLLAAVLAAVAPLASAAAAGTRFGSVVGLVTDLRGHAVADAPVAIEGMTAAGLRWHARTMTDPRGHFEFPHVPAGRYVVSSHLHGVGGDRERVAVRPGETVRVRLVLQ